MIQILKSFIKQNSKFDFVFSSLLALSIFLVIDTQIKIIWIIISFLLFISILNKPFYLFYTFSIVIVAFLIKHLINLQDVYKSFQGSRNVMQTTSMGPIVEIDGQRILIKSKEHFAIWDQIKIKGVIKPITNFSDFDFKTYMQTFKVNNSIDFPKIEIIVKSGDLRSKAIEYFSSGKDYYKKVAPLILLGKKTIESKAIYNIAFKLSVIHLFVISGFHISLFFLIIKKILMFFKLKANYASFFGILPIILYIFLLNFPTSASRAVVLVIISNINIYLLKKKYSSLQIISLVLIFMFLINPYVIYSISYIFTFMATFVIIYINSLKFKKQSNKFIAIAIGAYLSNLPIAIFLNGWISVFGFIYGIILSPLFVLIYVISLFLFPLKNIMNEIYKIFILILKFMSSMNIIIYFKKPNIKIIESIYIFPICCFIISKLWNLYMDKNNILLIKK